LDSLAILERGHFFPSPAAQKGVESDCPFCIARHIDHYRRGDQAIVMQGRHAGRLLIYGSSQSDGKIDQFCWHDEPKNQMRFNRDIQLTLPIEVVTVPFWLPKLSLRNCFIIDELATWFCNMSAAGDRFHWNSDLIIEVVRTCWRKRLPIDAIELTRVLLAHGMPEVYQEKFEVLFNFAMKTLIHSEGRSPLKKLRLELNADQLLYQLWKMRDQNAN
jgi:hypothetical protein